MIKFLEYMNIGGNGRLNKQKASRSEDRKTLQLPKQFCKIYKTKDI